MRRVYDGVRDHRELALALPLAQRWSQFLVAWTIALFAANAMIALLIVVPGFPVR